jgi:ATP-dependent DNA helicase RecG
LATPSADDPPAAVVAPLFAPLGSLRGVGEALSGLMARAAGGGRVIDLLFHLPDSFIDRRVRRLVREAAPGEVATLEVEVIGVEAPATSRQPTRVRVRDDSGFAELVFFNRYPAARLRPGARVLVSGRWGEGRQMPHPDFIAPADKPEQMPGIEAVWPLTAGLFAWHLRKPVAEALGRIPELPEWHDAALMAREGWPGFGAALMALQAPVELPGPGVRRRLAYDELLADQVALALLRRRARGWAGRALVGDGRWRREALARFGHALTEGQAAVLAEIDADLAAPRRMLRLLQGDVGAGKTLVAALAMLTAVEAGAQAAIMAPTELLARQHHRTLGRIMPVPVELLTGSVTGRARARVLAGLADGSVPVVVGTHALIQEGVAFRDLALAVIDEQHRFGVEHRLSLGAKGEAADVLVMTATPIPRTVLLTQWGEMQTSRLAGKPAGRQPIRTTVHSLAIGQGGAGLLGVPAGGGERGDRPVRCRGAVCRADAGVRPDRGAGAWAAGQCRARGRTDRFRRRADAGAGGDDRDRGGGGCARGQRDGGGARRALRPGAIAPVARAGGARRGAEFLPAAAWRAAARDGAAAAVAVARHRGRVCHRRRGFPAARGWGFAGHAAIGDAGVAAGGC